MREGDPATEGESGCCKPGLRRAQPSRRAADASSGPPGWLSKRLGALRAFSFPLSVLPVVIATAAVRDGLAEWDLGILAASALGVLLLHATGNLLNDYFDFRSGVDRRLEGDETRPGRFLVRGQLRPRDVLVEALFCLLLAAPPAAYLLWRRGAGILCFGVPAVLALYAYTGPPLHLKYRALGEFVIFTVFGPLLMAGAAYAQVGRSAVGWPLLLLSVPVGLVTTAVLLGNNMRDRDEDSEARVKTLAQLLGVKGMKAAYALSVLVPLFVVGGLVAGRMAPVGTGASFLLLPPACLLIRRTLKADRIPDIDVRTARYALAFMLVLGAGMVS